MCVDEGYGDLTRGLSKRQMHKRPQKRITNGFESIWQKGKLFLLLERGLKADNDCLDCKIRHFERRSEDDLKVNTNMDE